MLTLTSGSIIMMESLESGSLLDVVNGSVLKIPFFFYVVLSF